jgi:hypothetical protein
MSIDMPVMDLNHTCGETRGLATWFACGSRRVAAAFALSTHG